MVRRVLHIVAQFLITECKILREGFYQEDTPVHEGHPQCVVAQPMGGAGLFILTLGMLDSSSHVKGRGTECLWIQWTLHALERLGMM